MLFTVSLLLSGLLAVSPSLSAVLPRASSATGSVPLPERLLHHWPNGTWVENIAVRPNGNLLLTTSTPNGTVWHVKKPWTDTPEVELAYNFDEWVDRLIGIGETTPDKYIVVGSRFYSPDAYSSHVDRTFAAMELDFTKEPPSTRMVAWMPEAELLQGVAALPWDRSIVLISDQYVLRPRYKQVDWTPSPGQIWRLDTKTGDYELVMTDYAEMNTTYAHGPDVGINGIRILGNELYWVNQDNGGVYRVEIQKNGHPVPPAVPEVVSVVESQLWDDFAFGPGDEDLLWVTGLNAVYAVSKKNGTAVVVDGVGTSNNMSFPGPTSCQFGRTKHDSNVLYVTGNLYSVPDSLLDVKIGGWVRAIDTTGFHLHHHHHH
uniref:EupfF n=1 Tax=Penicillium janthinellum TaxID=5079 RepID=A0A9Y2YAC2_PENJA|nr:Chain A, EupfF [Penicillium janthinellum]7X36_B Chain B, EupfF [Penicillium janthinellum]7X36_C Chain C, EupfF [Penicillium janthinellum]7X36_D Chain D, EupfF [Penicillium janthinellum]